MKAKTILLLVLAIMQIALCGFVNPVSNIQGRPISTNAPVVDDFLKYNGTFWTPDVGGSSGIDGTMVANRVPYGLDIDTLQTSANLTFDGTVLTLGGRQTITAGTLPTGTSALAITATMPASAASESVLNLLMTSAGTGVVGKRGLTATMQAGYTDTGLTEALAGYNQVGGTGTDLNLTVDGVSLGNVGTSGTSEATTAGTNIGVQATAVGGAVSVGLVAKSRGAKSVAVLAGARTAGAANTIGVYAAIDPDDTPAFDTSGVVVADNRASGLPIIVAQAAGTTKWQATSKGYELHTVGTLVSSGDKIYNATVTMPAGAGSEQVWVVEMTSAGSGVVGKRGAAFSMLPGYTDAGLTVPLETFNTAGGTGNTLRLASPDAEPLGNLGAGFFATGATTGANVGVFGEAVFATGKNVGVIGKAISGAAVQNIGIIGAANGATANVGVYAGLAPGADLTLASAALVADNNAIAATIIDARDGGSSVWRVLDGGNTDSHTKQAIRWVLENVTSDPVADLVEGRKIWRSDTNVEKVYDGTAWAQTSGGITGTLATGEVVYATGAGTVDSDVTFSWDTATKLLTLGDGGTTKTQMLHNAGPLASGDFGYRLIGAKVGAATASVFRVDLDTSGSGAGGVTAAVIQVDGTYSGAGTATGLTVAVQETTAPTVGIAVAVGDATTDSPIIGVSAGIDGDTAGSGNRIAVQGNTLGATDVDCIYVGVMGIGNETDAAVRFGGFFGLGGNADIGTTSAALGATNGDEAAHIAVFSDGATPVVGVEDGGNVGIGSSAAVNPGAKLDVADGDTGAAALRLRSQSAPTSPNDGDVWTDSTQKAPTVRSGGNTQTLDRTLFTMTANSTITNTTTETTVFGSGVGTRTAAADYFVVGKTGRITLGGVISTDIATPGNLRIRVKLGAATLVDTGNFAVGANLVNVAWEIDVDLTNQTTGGSGTFGVSGRYNAAELLTTVRSVSLSHAGAPTADTTAANLIEVTAQWDTADADNKFVTTTGVVQGLN